MCAWLLLSPGLPMALRRVGGAAFSVWTCATPSKCFARAEWLRATLGRLMWLRGAAWVRSFEASASTTVMLRMRDRGPSSSGEIEVCWPPHQSSIVRAECVPNPTRLDVCTYRATPSPAQRLPSDATSWDPVTVDPVSASPPTRPKPLVVPSGQGFPPFVENRASARDHGLRLIDNQV
jgi:hypothetical protein